MRLEASISVAAGLAGLIGVIGCSWTNGVRAGHSGTLTPAASYSTEQVQSPAEVAGLPAIPFVETTPVIDGLVDESVVHRMRPVPLSLMYGESGAVAPPTFRLAYTATHLYLHVELDAAELDERDRAYQNGDGLILVLAKPLPDGEPTRRFHVLGFSPGMPAARWQQKFVWYRNVDLEFLPLEETLIATASESGRSWFEVLIPWNEVYPTHPWLSEGVGFNLCVTRALAGTASARYCLVEDRRVDSEQNPRRYVPLSFEVPSPGQTVQAAAVLDRNHVRAGESAHLRLATLAPAATEATFALRALSGEGTRLTSGRTTVDVEPGLQRHEIEAPLSSLPPGGYLLMWEMLDGDASGRLGVSVLPAEDITALDARLDRVRDRLAPGSVTTLRFQIEEVRRTAAALAPQETAANLRLTLDHLVADIQSAEAGHDPIASRTGILRRAYHSKVDGTLQPYSVRIPSDYRSDRRYPLLVFLHGSGQDDRNQVGHDWFPSNFIVLAPGGRGTSNWYTRDHAQDDIREAVDDVIANYAIDQERMVLSGFSMGGYGVYRTHKEDPERFSALAVFSGIPRIPGNPPGHPDFLESEDLAVFRDVSMFVFHGGEDRNCPIEQTREVVERLQRAGARVEFQFEADKGHEWPSAATRARFGEWLREML